MPTILDATVINQVYDTSGNGGRKLTRLSNGWLVFILKNGNNIHLYLSKDNMATIPQYIGSSSGGNLGDVAIVSKGLNAYILFAFGANITVWHYKVSGNTISFVSQTDIDMGQTSIGGVSITTNGAGTELHAAWASKNSTYPNSFNIRYAKGTINGDGSVTWGAVEQVTTYNNSLYPNFAINPTIVLDSNGVPIVIINQDNITISGTNSYNTNSWAITVLKRSQELNTGQQNVHSSWTWKHIYLVNGYVQSSPSAIFVPAEIATLINPSYTQGLIVVGWQGRDATDNSVDNIRCRASSDLGANWFDFGVSGNKITSGNTVHGARPSLTVNKNGKMFIVFVKGNSPSDYLDIFKISNTNGTWGTEEKITNATTNNMDNPSTLFDPSLNFSEPLFIYKDTQNNKVGFYGTWVVTTISVTPGFIGQKTSADKSNLLTYNITAEGTMGTITEKINGTIINTRTGVANGQQLTISLTQEQWDAIPYGKYAYRNLIPSFTSGLWAFHANVTVNSSSKITLNATANGQVSTITIPAFGNKDYTVSVTMSTNGAFYVEEFDVNNNWLTGTPQQITSPFTFRTLSNTAKIRLALINKDGTTGTITFENVILNEGTTAKPFVPFGAENTLTIEMGSDVWTYTFDKCLNANDDILSAVKGVQDLQTHLSAIKAQLGSAIRAKGGVVNDTDPFSAFVSAIANMQSKRWASGTATSSSSGSPMEVAGSKYGADTVYYYTVTVSGLTFIPSIILVYTNPSYLTIYNKYQAGYEISCLDYRTYDDGYRFESPNATTLTIGGAGVAYVNNTGFKLPVWVAGTPFNWIAIE
jgi:hypothetical protein